jgi:NAD(P)-dependent dehydrogenase (short-subunit alcohol dehydrogenase family)
LPAHDLSDTPWARQTKEAGMPLSGRVAIVTGAGGGLGREHARFLARKGARVVVNDLTQEAADRVAADIRASAGAAIGVAASVTDERAIASMVERTTAEWGRVDILVNNAGVLRDKSFAKMSLDDFRLVVDVHLMGAAICTKAVWDVMRAQNFGRIVMTTSSSGLYGNFGQANYGAAKMALVGLMQTLAIEGEKYGIRVNCLAPTAATQMTHGVLSEASLKLLDPALVSPALLALVGEDAPTRAIVCAGAGHFARASVTLSRGYYVGEGNHAGERVVALWDGISDRSGEIVPAYGFAQAERELASAGASGEVVAARSR